MPTPAQTLTRACRDLFAAYGWVTFKVGSTAGRNKSGDFYRTGTPGGPDFVAVKGQRYALCEVKAGADRLSASQLAFLAEVDRVFGNYLVLRSVEDALTFIQGE